MSGSRPAFVTKLADVRAGFASGLLIIRHLSFLISLIVLFNLPLLPPDVCQAHWPNLDWQSFERMVRDGSLSDQDGERAIQEWADRLEKEFPQGQFQKDVSFPLKGYSIKDLGGKNGDAYRPDGYRFLDGNRHQGHPAQDIFVRDRDQDAMDDLTGRPVDVLALAEGIVLSTFSDWKKTDLSREIRGGNYVWIYHPALKSVSYCAHLDKVFVSPGDRVQGGETVATLGRSGKNAALPRSPTHLHLMVLFSRNMQPMNPYAFLKSSRPKGLSLRTRILAFGAFEAPVHHPLTF